MNVNNRRRCNHVQVEFVQALNCQGSHATPSEVAITQFAYPGAIKSAILDPPVAPRGDFADAADYRRKFPDGRIGSNPALATPEAGRRVAEKLAREGYNLLIGAIPSSVSLALAQNLDRWDAAYFTVASKSDKLTGDSCKARSFRTNHSDAMDLAMIGEWAKGFKEKKFAVLAADYVWGRDSGESFERAVKAQGKTVALSLYAPLGTKDFSPYIAQLKTADVEAIWVAEVVSGSTRVAEWLKLIAPSAWFPLRWLANACSAMIAAWSGAPYML